MKVITKKVTIYLLLLSLLAGTSALAQKMSFGEHSTIDYNNERGVFDVYINGKMVLKNGYSDVRIGDQLISSKELHNRTMTQHKFKNETGSGVLYKLKAKSREGIMLEQSFFAYSNREFFTIEIAVIGKLLSSNQMFPLKGELISEHNFTKFRALFVPFDNDAFIRYENSLLQFKIENTSSEVTSFYDDISRKGFVIGTLDHDQWKTVITSRLISNSVLDFRVHCGFTSEQLTRDKIQHGLVKGDRITSSKILFGYFPDWRIGMERYAKTVRANEKPIVIDWKGPTPVGWNSWGVIQDKISLEKAKAVVDFFADDLKQFRVGDVCYIDLDSYWDNMLKGDNYEILKQFADYCRSKKLKPGIYWAPFVDWGSKDGPKRKVLGSDYTYGELWTKVNGGFHDFDGARALDPTHPGTQLRIKHMISNFQACGFEMIKIDFLGHGAVESSNFYDEKIATGMEAYQVGMKFLLKCLNDKMLVYAAISPNLASGKFVHVRRIACDAFKTIADTEYTLNSLTNGWWQTHLYSYIDADHVVFSDQSEAANRSRLFSSIVTGTLILGDDFASQGHWKETALKLFKNQELLEIIKDGKAFRPVEGNQGKRASGLFIKDIGKTKYLALFNYENQKATVEIDFSKLGIDLNSISSIHDVVNGKLIDLKHAHHIGMLPEDSEMLKIIVK